MASPVVDSRVEITPVASWRHTTRLATLFAVLAAAGLLLQGRSGEVAAGHPHLAPLYTSLIAAEWLLFRGVVAGLRPMGIDWRVLVGHTSARWQDRIGDALLGLLLCAGWVTIVLAARSSAAHSTVVRSLLPQGALETALWVALSLSAGFCEEIAFRGYFQRQFEAFTRSRTVALLLQAALFGIAHGYQGWRSALAIAGYGVLFGALAIWRENLRPGILAHALTDLVLGLA